MIAFRIFQHRYLTILLLSLIVVLLFFIAISFRENKVIELQSGSKISFVYKKESDLPIISLKMAFTNVGYIYDDVEKQGTALLVAFLLDKGAGSLDAISIQNILKEKGIKLSYDVDENNFYVNIKTLSSNVEDALALVSEMLIKPQFDGKQIEIAKNHILSNIKRNNEDAGFIAEKAWNSNFFPANHPFAQTLTGTVDTIAAINRDDLLAYAQNSFAMENLKMAVVGDVSQKDIISLVDKYFSLLPQSFGRKPQVTRVSELLSDIYVEDRKLVSVNKNLIQAHVIFGNVGVSRSDPDFYAAYILANIIGGGSFESRLVKAIRERLGFSYFAYMSLLSDEHVPRWIGGFATNPINVNKSLEVLLEELRQIREVGITREELDRAKLYLKNSFEISLDKNAMIANYLLSMQIYDLEIDFLKKRNSYIDNVSLRDINRVMMKMIDPDNILIAIVGTVNE